MSRSQLLFADTVAPVDALRLCPWHKLKGEPMIDNEEFLSRFGALSDEQP
jgi:hypothetical protein